MKFIKVLFHRITVVAFFAILEIIAIALLFHYFRTAAVWFESILRLASVFIIIYIATNSRHLSFDMMWILLVLLLPVIGTFTYILLGANFLTSRTTRALIKSQFDSKDYYVQNDEVEKQAMRTEDYDQFSYFINSAGYPVYFNQQFDYYKLGDLGYPVILEELKKAEKFIFLEYFIIEEGQMWNGILDILKQKAAQGVEVRVMYDDLGSIGTLPASYEKKLTAMGIQCVRFNKINPIIGSIMNHRDHRKILVIDGKTAFSGGINLADEYINVKEKYGHWKDNVMRTTGNAVWSYTVLFLTNWNALRPTDQDYTKYKVVNNEAYKDGFIVPYGVSPFETEHVGQDVYMNIINRAQKYLYIYTPYLIIDTDMVNTLILASHRGVDVRIIMPGVPDKRIVWDIGRSFYPTLIREGVKIYEYTPGFDHSKVFVCDDEIATVGTVNLDYRSLYLHYENGTFLYHADAIKDIVNDFEESFEVSKRMKAADVKMSPVRSFLLHTIKLFAAQM